MKYNCAKEFNLEEIYLKLVSGHKSPMVPAKNFFERVDELALLQEKMDKMINVKTLKTKRRVR